MNYSEESEENVNPHQASAPRRDYGSGADVRLDTINLTAPATWQRTKPHSSMHLAEFTLPHVDKDKSDGCVTICTIRGGVEANLQFARDQVGGTVEEHKREPIEIAGLKYSLVDLSGEYSGGHSQLNGTQSQAGYRMFVAILPVGEELYYIKAVGPEQTIAANVDAIDTFLRSVKQHAPDANAAPAAPRLPLSPAAVERGRGEGAEPAPEAGSGIEVHLKPISLSASTNWKRTKPRSSLVAAEFALPHAEKDTIDGRLTVSVVAGTVKENIDRWKGQFIGAIGDPRQEEIEVSGLKTTLVDFTGTFADQAGPFAPAVNRSDYRMIAAIIPIDDQLYVVKAVGPKQTIADQVEAINAFVRSLKLDK